MSRLGQQMFFARKRSANVAAAAPVLVTKALIPKESPSRNENQLIYKVSVLANIIHNFWWWAI